MKTIFLISSIFYLLGLKISHQFEFVKKSNPVENIIFKNNTSKGTSKSTHLDEQKIFTYKQDTVKQTEENKNLDNKCGNL